MSEVKEYMRTSFAGPEVFKFLVGLGTGIIVACQ